MIFKFTFSCDEGEDFRLQLEADSEATFLDLHKAILDAVHYKDDQMTSFFLCNEDWEKGQEITLVEMGSNFEYDNMVMEQTHLSELLEEQGQRLIYIFDPMFERYFFGSLREIVPGEMEGARCILTKGKAPAQIHTEDLSATMQGKDKREDWEIDADFYGDSQYDSEDIDSEGFQDLSFEDGSMF